jgi:hypothetical protein
MKKNWVEVEQNFEGTPPIERSEHSHAMYKGNLCIFGGEKTNLSKLDDFYEWNIETQTWKEIETKSFGPCRRGAHASTQHGDDFYLFGGFDFNNSECGDLWKFNFTRKEWIHVKTTLNPPFRHYHTLNTYKNYLVCFAGHSGSGLFYNDLIFFDVNKNEWIFKKPHSFQRYGHKSSIYNDKLYIFGGHIKSNLIDQISNDLVEYNFKTDSWQDCFQIGLPPSPRKSHGCVVVGDSLFVYGSTSDPMVHEYCFLEKRWYNYEFDNQPLSRFGHCMIPLRESFLVYGGYNNDVNNSFGNVLEFQIGKSRRTIVLNFDDFYSRSLPLSDIVVFATDAPLEIVPSPPKTKKRKRKSSSGRRKKIKY